MGNEAYLTDCPSSNTCCESHHDVDLYCQPACYNGEARLVGGSALNEGHVEVCNEGRWGTVCDDHWDYLEAQVICRQLGFPYTGKLNKFSFYTKWMLGAVPYDSAYFGQGTGHPIVLSALQWKWKFSVWLCTY